MRFGISLPGPFWVSFGGWRRRQRRRAPQRQADSGPTITFGEYQALSRLMRESGLDMSWFRSQSRRMQKKIINRMREAASYDT
jgi:hypothetical protein